MFNNKTEIEKIINNDKSKRIIKLLYKNRNILDNNLYNYIYMREEQLILQLAQYNIRVLKYISNELKNNEDFFLEIIKGDYEAFKYVSEELKNSKSFVLKILGLF